MDSSDDFLQCAQDPLAGFDEAYPEIAYNQRCVERQVKKKRDSAKKKILNRSHIISKKSKRGQKIIQIKIIDISNPEDSDDNIIVNTQYVVSEVVDDILDHTEAVVRKISKKICDESM